MQQKMLLVKATGIKKLRKSSTLKICKWRTLLVIEIIPETVSFYQLLNCLIYLSKVIKGLTAYKIKAAIGNKNHVPKGECYWETTQCTQRRPQSTTKDS